jgi:hypothetical protein
MAFVVVLLVVLALGCAAWVDHRDRRRRRRQRSAAETIGERRERIRGDHATNPVARERLREQPFGDY